MRLLLALVSAAGVLGLAVWAYQQNYRTQAALDEVGLLRAEIARLREERAVLAAEWAYLNRPDRLQDLADINFDRLGLMPLLPEQFARPDQIGYPPAPLALPAPILNPVEVQGLLEDAR